MVALFYVILSDRYAIIFIGNQKNFRQIKGIKRFLENKNSRGGALSMVINGHKTLLLRCDNCGKLMKYDINLFNISREIKREFICSCGENIGTLKTVDNSVFYLVINCFVCGHRHFYKLSPPELFNVDHLYTCRNNVKICYLGDYESSMKVEETDVIDISKYKNQFNNYNIVTESIRKLIDLNKEGKIYCECGNKNMTLDFFSDRIELKCNNCNSVQIIFTETEEDLDVLLKKERIHMLKHNIVCLDSLFEKNKDIKG